MVEGMRPTREDGSPAVLLPSIIHKAVHQHPSKTAVLFVDPKQATPTVVINYREMWAMATLWASVISSRIQEASAVSSGTGGESINRIRTVGLMVSEGPYLPLLHLAIILTRPSVAIVPLDRADPRLYLILEDSLPDLIILYEPLPTDGDGLSDRDVLGEAIKRFEPSVEGKRRADILKAASVITLKELLEQAKLSSTNLEDVDDRLYSLDDVSHVYFTSGSTGRPKGCISTLGALTSYALSKNVEHNVTDSSIVYVASSHTFDPSLGDFVATLAAGATIALSPRSSILENLASCLIQTKATHLLTTPVLIATIVDAAACRDLKVVALGGELMGLDIVRAWAGRVKLLNTYGVTECCVYQTAALMEPLSEGDGQFVTAKTSAARTRKDIGGSFGENRLHLMTRRSLGESGKTGDGVAESEIEDMVLVSGDEVGEIWISGPQVGVGYLNRPELTRAKFIDHVEFGKCFRTGDLARWALDSPDIEGARNRRGLIYLGRHDTQVKVSGRRVEVEEVEQVLMAMAAPRLLTSVAVVLNAATKILVAYVVPSVPELFGLHDIDASSVSASTRNRGILSALLRTLSMRQLPQYMVPARFEFLAALPQTATGKVARVVLSKKTILYEHDGEEEDEVKIDGEDDPLLKWITLVADAWRECLALPDTGFRILASMRFDELGGDSIKALLVTRRLSAVLGINQESVTSLLRKDDQARKVVKQHPANVTSMPLFVNGDLEPADLLKRPRLIDYARFLKEEAGSREEVAKSLTLSDESATPTSKVSPDDAYLCDLRSILYRAAGAGLYPIQEYIIAGLGSLDADGRTQPSTSVTSKTAYSTPLHCACLNGHLGASTSLIKLGASVSARDSRGVTPLHFASHRGPVELVDAILAALSTSRQASTRFDPILMTDDDGQTPLHHAARSGAPEAVLTRLIKYIPHSQDAKKKRQDIIDDATLRRRLEARDGGSRTALHWAAMNGHRGAVKVLLELGADVGAQDGEGEDAVGIAERLARCGAAERGGGVRSSVFGDIARMVGGRGTTKNVSKYLVKT